MTPTLSSEALERFTRDIDEAEKDNLCYAQVWVKDARALIAEVERFKPRPISEAPKEGELLLFCADADACVVAEYCEDDKYPDHVWATLDGISYHREWPSHFIPLDVFALTSDGGGS